MAAASRTATIVTVRDYDAWAKLAYELGAEAAMWNPRTKTGTASFRTQAEADEARREV